MVLLLTVFLLGGPFGLGRPKTVWHFHSFMTGVTKIHDFHDFSICLVQVKLFLKKEFGNFEKLKKKLPSQHQSTQGFLAIITLQIDATIG